jgi:hypothetical protein
MKKPHGLHNADAIHSEVKEGLKKLGFYADELNILSDRLHEISDKYTSPDILDQVADFRERIILKCREIDSLKSSFLNEEFVAGYKINRMGENAQIDLQKTLELHERTGFLQKEVKELWHHVNEFLAKWM